MFLYMMSPVHVVSKHEELSFFVVLKDNNLGDASFLSSKRVLETI